MKIFKNEEDKWIIKGWKIKWYIGHLRVEYVRNKVTYIGYCTKFEDRKLLVLLFLSSFFSIFGILPTNVKCLSYFWKFCHRFETLSRIKPTIRSVFSFPFTFINIEFMATCSWCCITSNWNCLIPILQKLY